MLHCRKRKYISRLTAGLDVDDDGMALAIFPSRCSVSYCVAAVTTHKTHQFQWFAMLYLLDDQYAAVKINVKKRIKLKRQRTALHLQYIRMKRNKNKRKSKRSQRYVIVFRKIDFEQFESTSNHGFHRNRFSFVILHF